MTGTNRPSGDEDDEPPTEELKDEARAPRDEEADNPPLAEDDPADPEPRDGGDTRRRRLARRARRARAAAEKDAKEDAEEDAEREAVRPDRSQRGATARRTPGEHAPDRGAARGRRREARPPAGRSLDDLGELDEVDLADLPPPPRSLLRRPPWWGLLGALLLALIVAGVLVGEWNEQRYFLVCSDKGAEGHQGRGFPWPFGHHRMDGLRYRIVPLSSAAQCSSAELGSEQELAQALLALVRQELVRRWPIETPKGIARARRLLAQGVALGREDAKALAALSGLKARLDVREAELILRQARSVVLRAKDRLDRARRHTFKDPQTRATLTRLTELVAHLLARLDAGRAPPPRPAPTVPPRRVGTLSTEPQAASRPSPVSPTRRTPPPGGPSARDIPPERPSAAPAPTPDAGVVGGGLLL